jgi:multidrug efflux pump subunit AcrA (membrane-fusion protein)
MRVPAGPKVKAVLLEDKMISSQQGMKFVYVVKPDNTIERRNIQTGTLFEGMRIVRDGVKAGESVVSTRLQMLQPGMPVMPVVETSKPAAANAKPAAANEAK